MDESSGDTNLQSHGKHVFVDYVNFQPQHDRHDGQWVLKILKNALNK